MKTAISIPDPIFNAAEKTAIRLGISRSELYARAVEEFIKEWKSTEITAALDDVYAVEDSTLDPAVSAYQKKHLRHEVW